MAALNKYELMEDRYNDLIAEGLTQSEAFIELRDNVPLYAFINGVDSFQDNRIFNINYLNTMFMLKLAEEHLTRLTNFA